MRPNQFWTGKDGVYVRQQEIGGLGKFGLTNPVVNVFFVRLKIEKIFWDVLGSGKATLSTSNFF